MCAPSATDAKGEAVSLPESAQWVHAWQSFWVEIWGSMDETTTLGVAGAAVDLRYNTDYLTAQPIEYGAAFTEDRTGMIDDAAGQVTAIGGRTLGALERAAEEARPKVKVKVEVRRLGSRRRAASVWRGISEFAARPSAAVAAGLGGRRGSCGFAGGTVTKSALGDHSGARSSARHAFLAGVR